MNVKRILDLLEAKHTKDCFIVECLMGPRGAPRLDAWGMLGTWEKTEYFGYEVKVERSDFLRDTKWPVYLDACNRFSFVCPWGMIKPEEVGDSAGLLWASKQSARLYTKKIAPYREIKPPIDVIRHVLMWHTQRNRCRSVTTEDSRAYWERWLHEKEEKRDLGHRVSAALRQLVSERITAVEDENIRLKERIDQLEELDVLAREMGLSFLNWQSLKRQVKDAHRRLVSDNGLLRSMTTLRQALGDALSQVEGVQLEDRT